VILLKSSSQRFITSLLVGDRDFLVAAIRPIYYPFKMYLFLKSRKEIGSDFPDAMYLFITRDKKAFIRGNGRGRKSSGTIRTKIFACERRSNIAHPLLLLSDAADYFYNRLIWWNHVMRTLGLAKTCLIMSGRFCVQPKQDRHLGQHKQAWANTNRSDAPPTESQPRTRGLR
jgi:hypothetical protein